MFPQAFENNSSVISSFFRNSPRYSQVKVHLNDGGKFTGVKDTGANLPPVTTETGGKFATCVNDTGGKLPLSLSLSTTAAANNGNNINHTGDTLKGT
jgi:hypothetical protein